jgi:3-hydroxyisobutyrate dehydrogenase-like beta-hydroxyacid dehydrogenase
MNPDRRVGVIGLGLMGTAITERLLDHSYQPFIWNRSRDKAQPLAERGAQWSENPLAECRRVIVSLYSSDVVGAVMEQFSAALSPGQIVIDTTTGEPTDAERLAARLAEKGVRYLDAPISGSSQQTRRGEATVMVGGELADFDACRDLWPILGGKVFHCGACGSAARVKLVTNLVLGLNRAALAEGLIFAESLGIDPSAALDVLKGSAAYSKAMDIKGRKMIERDYQVQARLSQHFKDIRLILDSARANNLPLPLTEVHATLLSQAEAAGYGDADNCAVVEAYRKGQR